MNYYSTDFNTDLNKISNHPCYEEWFNIVEQFLVNDELQRRKLFRHHDGALWNHLINVSFKSFLMAKKHSADEKVCAIAGLLHDFYPKAYKYSKELEELDKTYLDKVHFKQSLFKMHGFTHPKEAADNARLFFKDKIDDKVYSSICTHMFPLTLTKIPKSKEAWIVTFIDKKSSTDVIKEVKYIPGIIKNKIKKKK